MEKEKILQQLEEKLLPSVQNLERNQATDHDFFPALLWLILAKSKDSESLLKDIASKYSEELKSISATILENNNIYHEKTTNLFPYSRLKPPSLDGQISSSALKA